MTACLESYTERKLLWSLFISRYFGKNDEFVSVVCWDIDRSGLGMFIEDNYCIDYPSFNKVAKFREE